MATNVVQGKNFSYDGTKVQFFDEEGAKFGNSWAINVFPGVLAEVDPDTAIIGAVQRCIDIDVENGNGDKIAQLQISPSVARSLFLNDIITPKHLRRASESDDDIIIIPGVEVCGRMLTVIILRNPSYGYATADKDGIIIL